MKTRLSKAGSKSNLFSGVSSAVGSMMNKGGKAKPQFSRGLIAVGIFLFFGILFVFFGGLSSSASFLTSGGMLDSDRARYYNVKVLPATLSDDELASLPQTSFSYITVVDAGSSGCRAHVYRYGKLGNLDGPLYILPQHKSLKVKPGLSTFKDHPTDAGKSLQGLIDFMKDEVPESDWSSTPFFLKATAGLRMLEENEREAILTSIRTYMGDPMVSPFLFRDAWAKVIPGNEEGGFGWLAYNYLMKLVGPHKKHTSEKPYAVIEMGGASAQVSQMATTAEERAAISPHHLFEFEIDGEQYTLFTHSYLGYGAEQAREALNHRVSESYKTASDGTGPVQDPCLNSGFKLDAGKSDGDVYYGPKEGATSGAVGASTDGAKCSTEVSAALFSQADSQDNAKCSSGRPPFKCVQIPDFVRNAENMMTFENFFYTASGIGVATTTNPDGTGTKQEFPLQTTPQSFAKAAAQVCQVSWEGVETKYPVDGQDKDKNIKWCFAASYMAEFLLQGMSLEPSKPITITKEVAGSEVEWALGAAYKEAAELLRRSNFRPPQ